MSNISKSFPIFTSWQIWPYIAKSRQLSNFANLAKSGQILPYQVESGQLWLNLSKLAKSYPVFPNLASTRILAIATSPCQNLPNIAKYCQILSILAKSCQILSNLVKSHRIPQLWSNFGRSYQLAPDPIIYCPVLRNFVKFRKISPSIAELYKFLPHLV